MDHDALNLATGNAAAMWQAVAWARGYDVLSRPDLLAVTGDERFGTRVLLLRAAADGDGLASVIKQYAPRKLVVEDPFSTVDATGFGLSRRSMPVMLRRPGALPPTALDVSRVRDASALSQVERVVVTGFALEYMQPYRPGEAFPVGLLGRTGVEFFLVHRDGEAVGACLTVTTGGVAGLYWVTTMPAQRSQGVARELMHGVLAELGGVPVTLDASRAGRPLYDSLGFDFVADSTWWFSSTVD